MRETAKASTHHALADERRAALLEALRQAPTGSTCTSSQRASRIHANTARWHLGVLADAGLVESRPGPSGARARRGSSTARPREATAGGRDEYRLLATHAHRHDSRAVDDGAGRAADGRSRPGAATSCAARSRSRVSRTRQAKAEVVALLDEQGFASESRGDEILR